MGRVRNYVVEGNSIIFELGTRVEGGHLLKKW